MTPVTSARAWLAVPLVLGLAACGVTGEESAATAASSAAVEASCGGAGQRACCLTDGAPECGSGLVAAPGCAGDCACPVLGAIALHCEAATSCGGRGERACCASERTASRPGPCAAGLVPVLGCSGDCTCPGFPGEAIEMCSALQPMAEPEVGQVALETPACAMRGYADIHLHLFGDQAHGGAVLAGAPFDVDGGVNAALAQDFGTARDLVDGYGLPPASTAGPNPLALCPGPLPCGPRLWHGHHEPLSDTAGHGTRDGSASNLGAPLFNGWPRWTSTTHQQAYHRWLERAWRGGLRLAVVLAVTNEGLCRAYFHARDVDCGDSMASIDAQLATAHQLEAYLDRQAGGPGLGWFRIVTSPAEARQVIASGRLAVVLGIEVDNLFGCKQDGPCDDAAVAAAVRRYRALGVRHLFPIHDFDNGFGGTATWQDGIDVGNATSEHHWWWTEDCSPEGYGFWLDEASQASSWLAEMAVRNAPFPEPFPFGRYPPGGPASCNRSGLTPLGRGLIAELISQRMIIDVDHMSRRSLDDTLALTEPRQYPLVAGHVLPFDLHRARYGLNLGRHERMRTAAQLEAIRRSGGLVAAMLKDDVQDTALKGTKVTLPYGGQLADDCRHSSRTFGQAYQYLVDRMAGPVALGSDFNGIAGHVGPRFGSQACGLDGTERHLQARTGDRLVYPFRLPGFGTFDRQVTGEKRFDFNVDGLAHVGLLPDLIADLAGSGARPSDLDALFRSAEGYVALWERVEAAGSGAAPGPCVDRTVEAGPGCVAVASVASDALASDPGLVLSQSPPGPFGLGATRVELTATARDGCSAPVACTGTVTVVDTTPPRVSAVEAHPARLEAEGDRLRRVTVTVEAADACGPSPTCRLVDVSTAAPPCRPGQPDAVITGPLTVELRASLDHRGGDDDGCGCHHEEHDGRREGRRTGRTYTLTVECADAAGNAARGTTTVEVVPEEGGEGREGEAYRSSKR